jgi:hypothetical protein
MTRRILLSVVIVVCIISVIQLFAFPDVLRLRVVDRYHYDASGITYNSVSPRVGIHEAQFDTDASMPFLHVNPSTGLFEDLTRRSFHISMTFVPRSLDGYPNAFQTAPLNDGIRLEFSPGMVGLIVSTYEKWQFIPISIAILPNSTHTIDITIDEQNRVRVILDGQVAVDEVIPELSYRLSDIVVGSGFSKQRPFVGEIRDASVSFQIGRMRPNADGLVFDLEMSLIAIVLICLYFLIGPERMARTLSLKDASPPWQRAPRVDSELTGWPYGFAIPLPNDFEATLHLSRHSISPHDLRYLAREAERAADEDSTSTSTSVRDRSWNLPDGSVAVLHPRNGATLAGRAYRQLAQYVRDFADVLDR